MDIELYNKYTSWLMYVCKCVHHHVLLFAQLEYSKSTAGMLSTVFEVGGVVGTALIGVVIDKWVMQCSVEGYLWSA